MINRASIMVSLRRVQADLNRMGVKDLWLYGSVARDEASPRDVDLLVEFRNRPTLTGFMDLKFFLEGHLGMPVDLQTKRACPDRFMKRIQTELLHVA